MMDLLLFLYSSDTLLTFNIIHIQKNLNNKSPIVFIRNIHDIGQKI